MTPLQAVLLGLLQGLTEFLPVSSSGHLVLGQELLGIHQPGITFEVFVHFGTLLAVVTAFWNDILNLIRAFFKFFKPTTFRIGLARTIQSSEYAQLLVYILIGTIPAGIIGILFDDVIESVFGNPRLTCVMLLITGCLLLVTRFNRNNNLQLNNGRALVIGLAQAVAILPGISRSGSTISTALYQGIESQRAAQFSFLLALPAILGATVLKLKELLSQPYDSGQILTLIIGAVVAYLSGYIAIKVLIDIVRRGKLYWFAPYCFLIALAGLIWL